MNNQEKINNYRPDIDGLRAIAVIAVIFYHAGTQFFSGGYIGVDVFFVISGFLITGMIIKEILANDFSIFRFYERRIRRIFPAYFVMAIFVLIFGSWLYNTNTYIELSRSVIAASLSVANILFWSQAGYFDAPSLLKPMLHTWSLAVEEQFYVFLPIILLLIFRFFRNKFIPILIFILVASLALSIYVTPFDQNSTFYLAQFRAWELLVGSLIAIKPIRLDIKIQNILAFLGLGMILVSIYLFSDATAFPGYAAVLPVFGAGLIINAGVNQKTLVGSILGWQPVVFLGKISYSLYLWHWPLLIFMMTYLITPANVWHYSIWLLVTLLISILSWRFIETPFRSKTFLRRPRIFIFAGGVAGLIVAASLVIIFTNGLPQRFSKQNIPNYSEWNWEWGNFDKTCLNGENVGGTQMCQTGLEGSKSFLVWGDSFARSIKPAIDKVAIQNGMSGLTISEKGCMPLLKIKTITQETDCPGHNDQVLEYIQHHPEIKTIVLIGNWQWNGTSMYIDVTNPSIKGSSAKLFDQGMRKTIRALQDMDRMVVIVTQIPTIGYDVPSASFVAGRTGRDLNTIIAPSQDRYKSRYKSLMNIFDNLKKDFPLIRVIDIYPQLCKTGTCLVMLDNKPLYQDRNHLSTLGALYVANSFEPVFSSIKK